MILFLKLAKDNIMRNKRLYWPFILSSTGIIALSYIVCSLSMNEEITATYAGQYVQTFLSMGVIIIFIFAIIFLAYTNSFIIKKRKSELGLYNVLGLSKGDICKVLFLEMAIVYLLSMILGIAIGILLEKLAFLILLKLLSTEVIFGFNIEISAIITILVFYSCLFLGLYIYSAISVYKTNPVDLLRENDRGEREPKAKWLMALLGLVLMLGGYYLANMNQTVMMSVGIFFPAVVLVILGTYLLFTAGSIAILKALKKNKKYYYKTGHFIAISNLMFRMKKNAAGLASIAIMATMILIMTASTTSLWFNMQKTADALYPRDMLIEIDDPNVDDKLMIEEINDSMSSIDNEALDLVYYNYDSLYGYFVDQNLIITDSYDNKERAFTILDATTYNELTNDDIELKKGEMLVVYEGNDYPYSIMSINGQNYQVVKELDDNIELLPDSNLVNNSGECTLVFSDEDVLNIAKPWRIYLFDLKKPLVLSEGNGGFYGLDFLNEVRETFPENALNILAKEDFMAAVRSMYAAFLFLGTFLGVAFMFSITLIMYYKQISEGDEDRERYLIMAKVGLSDKEIKKTINSQVIFVFFMPLVVSIIHLLGSYKMVNGIVSVLMLKSSSMYFYTCIVATLAFAIFYIVVYLLTKKTYYHIVTRN